MAGRGTINYPSHMGNEDTANRRSPEAQSLIKSYTLHFLTMILALWVTHFLCAYKVVCCSCSQSQQTRIFFSFHTIWLEISGNLDVSFGVFHWLRTEELQTREASPLAQGVSAREERREPRIPPYPPGSNDPMTAVNSHWIGRKEGTWEVCLHSWKCERWEAGCAVGTLLYGAGLCWGPLEHLSQKSFQRAKQYRLFLARPGLAHSDACFRRGALG